jgi:iron-sulfur cluster protein
MGPGNCISSFYRISVKIKWNYKEEMEITMNRRAETYNKEITKALGSPRLLEALHRFGDAYLVSREKAFRECDFDSLRQDIAEMKDDVIENNREYLDRFTARAEEAGAVVFYAETAEDANRYIADLVLKRGVKKVVKSKSMVSEEIDLNLELIRSGVSVDETDLGEWIVQLAEQRPSHMVMPAIHMFRDQVAELFSRETGRNEPPEIEHLVNVARKKLRGEYLEADMGITGANIAVAENGSIVLVTNEGNARLVSTLPPIHVALVGREKLVPALEDAEKIIRVLPKNATGQNITSYVTWIRGSVPSGEKEKELHIVVLDNGRSRLAESETCKSALRCIRCGACANVCPVYQTIGGHVFGHIYIGAIGIILRA